MRKQMSTVIIKILAFQADLGVFPEGSDCAEGVRHALGRLVDGGGERPFVT